MSASLTTHSSPRTLFVTGTDTGVGKTRAACALLQRAQRQGLRAVGYKPVASGADATADGLRNEDALALQAVSAPGFSYAQINPCCFEPPIAPHLAARRVGRRIEPEALDAAHQVLAARADLVIVEGAGGWLVPLNESATVGDWVGSRGWPVVLVVAIRLGCLNHALLSAEAIASRTTLAGWIAALIPPALPEADANLAELRARLPAPCWGVIDTGALDLRPEMGGFERWLAGSTQV